MRLSFSTAVSFFAFTLCAVLHGEDAPPLPVKFPAKDPHIQYIGRFDNTPADSVRFAWSGSRIVARFEGNALNADIAGKSTQYLQVLVDGKPGEVLKLADGRHVYAILKDLPAGPHTIELFQRTEAAFGTGQFFGFQASAGGRLIDPPARSPRRIEFIGDSITSAYGNEGVNAPGDKWRSDTENQYLSYASVTARALGAEATIISASGGWLTPNPKGSAVLPQLFLRVLPGDKTSQWDFRGWIPQAVVINLGTNDADSLKKGHDDWVRQYHAFLAVVRSHYPDAHIFIALGPMLYDDRQTHQLTDVRNALQAVVTEEKAAGRAAITLVEFARQNKADGIGNSWHPSVKTDQKMADVLVAAIKQELPW